MLNTCLTTCILIIATISILIVQESATMIVILLSNIRKRTKTNGRDHFQLGLSHVCRADNIDATTTTLGVYLHGDKDSPKMTFSLARI